MVVQGGIVVVQGGIVVYKGKLWLYHRGKCGCIMSGYEVISWGEMLLYHKWICGRTRSRSMVEMWWYWWGNVLVAGEEGSAATSSGNSTRVCLGLYPVISFLSPAVVYYSYSVSVHYYFSPASQLVLRLLCVFHVCTYICVSALITCAIITSCSLHCYHVTLLSRLRQLRRLLCVATTSSLAQLRVRDGYWEAEAT